MEKKKSFRLIALLMTVLMTLCLTACGGSSGGQEEGNAPDGEQLQDSTTNEEEMQETTPEDNGPKEVSAIDMNVAYEYNSTYYDEEEGYDREYTRKIAEEVKFIDYKVIPATDPSVSGGIVVMHYKETLEETLLDAQGNEMDELVDFMGLSKGLNNYIDSHEVPNVDTGETEEIDDYDFISYSDLESYYSDYEGLEDYLREVNFEDFDWPIWYPSYDEDLVMPHSNTDCYYFYEVEHLKGTLVFSAENDILDEDDVTITSYNDAKQIMRIEL